MAISRKLLLILLLALMSYKTAEASKPKVTHFQFYMQDIVGGPNANAIQVTKRLSNQTGPNQDPIGGVFGSLYAFDNELTATPDPNSTVVGRAQGLSGFTSMEEYSLLVIGTYKFTTGAYNGSAFSVLGRNPYLNQIREVPVVGGTGFFRLARGYIFMTTHSMTKIRNVFKYDVTIVHD